MLGRHSQQFRAIQKRLLARYRDKTPIGLAELDNLLDGTLMHVSQHKPYVRHKPGNVHMIYRHWIAVSFSST